MKLLHSLISSTALLLAAAAPTLATISISSVTLASQPVDPLGCPDGWVPAPNPQLGCIPNRIKPKNPNRNIKNPTPSSQVEFPSRVPQNFRIDLCDLGVVDPIDCPENNPKSLIKLDEQR
ncbi:MAG: hypothetical protein KME17_22905 [Cyanosarcina radialis HA8281-LM2]|jgi:hypothetical protein|nr:hypothetical protein [Cyanosarcina radialis HA8281-LM2]